MFTEDQLQAMSHDERCGLIRALVAMENQEPAPDQSTQRRRAIILVAIVICCVVLAAWVGVLAVTLPRYYRAGGWRGAWVGFDLAELAAFVVTGWAAWRRRQMLLICLVVLATLLCCDAWFDVVLDARTKGFEVSLLSALLVELPLAALAIIGARRLLRATIAATWRYRGEEGQIPPLRKVELLTSSPGGHLRDIFADPDSARPDVAESADGMAGLGRAPAAEPGAEAAFGSTREAPPAQGHASAGGSGTPAESDGRPRLAR